MERDIQTEGHQLLGHRRAIPDHTRVQLLLIKKMMNQDSTVLENPIQHGLRPSQVKPQKKSNKKNYGGIDLSGGPMMAGGINPTATTIGMTKGHGKKAMHTT